jgi:hypothetical protein
MAMSRRVAAMVEWASGSARMLRAQRQDRAVCRGSRLLACSEQAVMRARGYGSATSPHPLRDQFTKVELSLRSLRSDHELLEGAGLRSDEASGWPHGASAVAGSGSPEGQHPPPPT